MAAIRVFTGGKWAMVGRRRQQPWLVAKAFPAGMYSGSVELVGIGISASIGLPTEDQVNSNCRRKYPGDASCGGNTGSPNPQLELRR